jgi:hypothetical protein
MTTVCQSCRGIIPAGASFCPTCGTAVPGWGAGPTQPPPPGQPWQQQPGQPPSGQPWPRQPEQPWTTPQMQPFGYTQRRGPGCWAWGAGCGCLLIVVIITLGIIGAVLDHAGSQPTPRPTRTHSVSRAAGAAAAALAGAAMVHALSGRRHHGPRYRSLPPLYPFSRPRPYGYGRPASTYHSPSRRPPR